MKKNNNKKNIFASLFRLIKIRHLVLLTMLIMANSFAWFVYATKVKVHMKAHIDSWDIHFKSEDDTPITNMLFDVARMYPGMDEAKKVVKISNSGSTPAYVEYEIESVKILGETYEVNNTTTSENLETMLKNSYPFKIEIKLSSVEIPANLGKSEFQITLNWAYESGNDQLDTTWGERAYAFYATHPNEKAIDIKLKVKAIQEKDKEKYKDPTP